MPSFRCPELSSATLPGRTSPVGLMGVGHVLGTQVLVHAPWVSALCLVAWGLGPLSGSLFLSPSSSQLKLPFTGPPLSELTAIFLEGWSDFQSQRKLAQHKCHSPGFPILPLHGIIFLCPSEPGWLCDMLWAKQCEPKRHLSLTAGHIQEEPAYPLCGYTVLFGQSPSKGHFLLFQTMLQ